MLGGFCFFPPPKPALPPSPGDFLRLYLGLPLTHLRGAGVLEYVLSGGLSVVDFGTTELRAPPAFGLLHTSGVFSVQLPKLFHSHLARLVFFPHDLPLVFLSYFDVPVTLPPSRRYSKTFRSC